MRSSSEILLSQNDTYEASLTAQFSRDLRTNKDGLIDMQNFCFRADELKLLA
jgi:hypothetical protein